MSIAPPDFRVVALIAAFNEEDIIDQVVADLIRQGILVYLIDDGSTDRTAAAVTHHLGRGLLKIERRERSTAFDWTALLRRKEELSSEIAADWFLHQDADEFRESPWIDLTLREALWEVDLRGYSAVDFKVLNFRPTTDQSERDVRDTIRFYEPAHEWDRLQVKAWRKQPSIELASSGGHEVVFQNRRVCPVRFLSRHYPVRSQRHGTRKVFQERLPRFLAEERERRWHVQYDALEPGHNFVRSPSELLEFDPVRVRIDLSLENRDVESAAAQSPDAGQVHQHIATLEQRVQDLQGQAEAAAVALAHANESLTTKQAEVVAIQASLSNALERIASDARERHERESEHSREIADVRRRLSLADAAALQIQEQKDSIQRQKDHTESQKEYLERQLREYAAEASAARREVDALKSSKSWKITAPLRTVYGLGVRAETAIVEPVPARLRPVSDMWGLDRGMPIDRYYIEQFLRAHRTDVQGRVLEVKDAGYARMLDDGRIQRIDVLDVDPTNENATIIADLAAADNLEGAQFDCFILTQTLHIIYDVRAALGHAIRLLKPGGVLLCTIPAISRVNYENGGLESGDYWRLTRAAALRLFEGFVPAAGIEIATFGNVAVCAGFLYGLSAAEISQQDLEYKDPWFPLIHAIRAVKA
jgi:SAM-dependent methyltransferase